MARLAPFLVSAVVTSVFFINFCAWIFGCGCRSLWAGAAIHCNVHHAAGRHCPWCSHGVAGYAVVYLGMLAPQLLVSLRMRRGFLVRSLAAIAVFPLAGLVLAWIFGSLDRYWGP